MPSLPFYSHCSLLIFNNQYQTLTTPRVFTFQRCTQCPRRPQQCLPKGWTPRERWSCGTAASSCLCAGSSPACAWPLHPLLAEGHSWVHLTTASIDEQVGLQTHLEAEMLLVRQQSTILLDKPDTHRDASDLYLSLWVPDSSSSIGDGCLTSRIRPDERNEGC